MPIFYSGDAHSSRSSSVSATEVLVLTALMRQDPSTGNVNGIWYVCLLISDIADGKTK